MRSVVANALWIFFLAGSVTAQVTVHSSTRVKPDAAPLAVSNAQTCCECRKPPGGKYCCQADAFVGCVVRNDQCECTCFSTSMKRLPDDLARDVLKTLLGEKGDDVVASDLGFLLNRVITATERGKSLPLHFEDGTELYITLAVPKSAEEDLKWFRERVPPVSNDTDSRLRLRKQ